MSETYILRVWMPDRPGALGALASRIGGVGGDVTGIEILERGAGRAIDELVIELADGALVESLVAEIHQVDGVDIESIRPAAEALHDPRVDALETAALLVGAPTPSTALDELCIHGVRTVGAHWGVILELSSGSITSEVGECPPAAWIAAFVAGSQSSARVSDGDTGPSDMVWAPLPAAGRALVMGRNGESFRARERRQAAALARIVDTRFRELMNLSRQRHPSVNN